VVSEVVLTDRSANVQSCELQTTKSESPRRLDRPRLGACFPHESASLRSALSFSPVLPSSGPDRDAGPFQSHPVKSVKAHATPGGPVGSAMAYLRPSARDELAPARSTGASVVRLGGLCRTSLRIQEYNIRVFLNQTQFAVGARETREGGRRSRAPTEAGEDRGAVADAGFRRCARLSSGVDAVVAAVCGADAVTFPATSSRHSRRKSRTIRSHPPLTDIEHHTTTKNRIRTNSSAQQLH
jgi:hypothetical protein